MPNNSTNKKRSSSIDSAQKCTPKGRKRKRSVSTDEEEEQLDESATAIENKLRSVAKMNNLSPVEMKKLIKKLVANDHVLAFITLKAEDELAREEAEKIQTAVIVNDIDPSIPKLTRAKARELNKPPLIAIPSLTEPHTSEIATLIQEDFHSDEEDEEYIFKEEDFASDEDPNLTSSDMESQPRTPMTSNQCQEIMESPLKLSEDGVFKVPREIEGETVGDEIIATRTRSKFCLEQTTIEDLQSEFIPPDDHLDVADIELYGNDQDWMEFLNTFSKPLNNNFVGDDDDPVNDPEYVAAEKVPFDAEELRDVNISKKEVTELIAELFEGLLNEGICMESIELETPKKFLENNNLTLTKDESQDVSMNENNHQLSFVDSSQTQSLANTSFLQQANFVQAEEFSFQPEVMSTPQVVPNRTHTLNDELFIKTPDNVGPLACSEYVVTNIPPPVSDNVGNSFEVSYIDPTSISNRVVYTQNTVPTTNFPKTESVPAWPRDKYVATQRLIKREYAEKFEKLKHTRVQEVNLSEESTGFTNQQYQILQQQLRIHVQFCTQNFFQTYSHPDLWKCAAQQKQMLLELDEKAKENATFAVWNLKPALELVHEWEKELEEDSEENALMMQFIYKEMRRISRSNHRICRFSPRIMKKLLSSPAIMYPEYLPKIPFAAQQISFHSFAPAESILLAMGLERYLNDALKTKLTHRREKPMCIVCERIARDLICGKKPKRLQNHIRELRKSDSYNPVKYYFEHQKAPPVEHNLIWIDFTNVLPPNQRIAELPMVWQDFLHVLNAGGIINNTYPENYISFVKEITGEQIDFPLPGSGSTKFGNRSVKWSQKQTAKEKENETPSVTININYMFGQIPDKLPVFNESQAAAASLLELSDIQPNNFSVCQSPLKNTTNTSTTTTPERQKKLTEYFTVKEKENTNEDLGITNTSKAGLPKLRNKSRFLLKTKYSPSYFSKKLQVAAKRFRSAKNLQKRYENLLSAYRLNLEREFLSYKHRGLRSVFRNFKALELYTNLLRDLKMNCKKSKPSDEMTVKRKTSEDQDVPKSRKANRQEENSRHMLLPDSAEDANRKDAIYAFNFYEKVEEVLKQSKRPEDCKKFNYILRSFNPKKDKVSELYYKLEKLFVPDHPELAHVFLTFLLPHEAAAIGKFFEHFMYTNAGTFFSKLNVYFNKQPAQIRKIYACFSELSSDPDVNVEKMKSKIFPLLKGNSFLIDWFTQLFSSEPPPERLYGSAENTNMKEVVSNQSGDYVETLHPNDLLDSPTESQTCQLRYINGRIFYGTKIPLPAKLSFIAKSYQADELNESLEDETHTPTEIGCVHGIREYGEKRLAASINDCSSDDNDKSEEEKFNAIVTDSNETEEFEICDDVTLRAHATRLNPSYYSNSYYNSSTINNQSSCHRPLKLTSSAIEDGKYSPRKIYKASPSATIISGVVGLKERRKSPKKNLIKSPVSGCKRLAADTSSKSNAIATAKKLRSLIEEESYSDPDGTKKKLTQKRKEEDFKSNDDSIVQAKDDDRLSPKKEDIKLEVTLPWTRDEDKVILEEIKSGFKDKLLYERIKSKITNRTLLEIEERHKFLMDFLSKLQSSK